MKKSFLSLFLFALIAVLPTNLLYSETNCECGSHSVGITSYNVAGDDCCNGTPGDTAFEYTYIQQPNGVWELDTTTEITGTSAQNKCCNPG